MNPYTILERRGQWLVLDLATNDFDVFSTREEAERYIQDVLTLAGASSAILECN